MPRPIPPPPPQPSAAETHLAVRSLYGIVVAVAVFFALVSSTYSPDALMVQYGRDNAQSWALWQARTLDEAALRSHDGGKVTWLLGSSVLRDSFNVPEINAQLVAADSPWRVAKIGQNRGAPGMTAGLLRHLPIRPGDRVMHSLSPDNFRKDWLHAVGLPEERVMLMHSRAEAWQLSDWSVQEKLENTLVLPLDFVLYHEEYMQGLTKWLEAVWWLKKPKKAKPGYHASFRKIEKEEWVEMLQENPDHSRNFLTEDDLDYTPTQFNIRGLERIRAHCTAQGAELVLLDLPHRPEYYSLMLAPAVQITWRDWGAQQPELVAFSPMPSDHFYDFKHPNYRGREVRSAELADWIVQHP